MPKFLRQYALFSAFVILACSSSGGDDGSSEDADGTASLTTCTGTCDHLYDECDLVMVDNTDTELSEDECVDSCDEELSEVVDCLDESDCSDVDEVNDCFLLGADAEEEDAGDEEEEEDTDECDSDSDCGTCERCSDGTCRDCGEGPFGCYC